MCAYRGSPNCKQAALSNACVWLSVPFVGLFEPVCAHLCFSMRERELEWDGDKESISLYPGAWRGPKWKALDMMGRNTWALISQSHQSWFYTSHSGGLQSLCLENLWILESKIVFFWVYLWHSLTLKCEKGVCCSQFLLLNNQDFTHLWVHDQLWLVFCFEERFIWTVAELVSLLAVLVEVPWWSLVKKLCNSCKSSSDMTDKSK